jgi:FkbM family methyltransferase
MLARTLKRISRRVALEARGFPIRVQDRLLAGLGEDYKYQRGMIGMRASVGNLRRNGFHPGFIVDVGAYRGEWSRMARGIYPDAPICMLEANPEQEPFLSAASREIGAADFRIALLGPNPAESVAFHVRGTGSSVFPENTATPCSIAQLSMTTLDRVLLTGQSYPAPYFLKLDVQGFELEILRGAEQVLQKTEAALLEVSLLEYNQGAPLFAEVVGFMAAQSFVVYDVSGFFRRESDGALYRIVLLFVRESSALRARKRFWNREAELEMAPTLQ